MTTELKKLNLAPQYPADGYDYFWQPPDWVITDPTEHIIEGYASLPNLDDQGDVIPLDVIDRALPRFMQWANLREMHDKSAAGKVLKATVDEHGLRIVARVDDPTAWAKVKSGVYQGFSVGGDIPEDATEQRADGARIIKEVMLNEISLVDRPANPKARISVVKFEKHFTGKVHKHACEKHKKEDCEECGCDRLVGHPDGTGHSSGMADNPEAAEKIAKRPGVNPSEGEGKYGENAHYADPKNKKYPLDTPEHARAAASYFGMPKNRAKYSPADRKTIDARIAAAERRHGIGGKKKTEKGITMTTLEKVKATLVDPDQIKALEVAEEIIAKASGGEWHSQRDVGSPKGEAEAGVDLEDNDVGSEDPVEDFIKAEDGAEMCKADGKGDEGEGDGSGRAEDDAMSKADGGFMSHANKCHSSLQSCMKAFGSEDHPAKQHAQAAMGHLNAAKKCFGKASETGELSKALGSDPNLEERLTGIEEAIEFIARKQANTSEYFAKVLRGLPRARALPPEAVSRDEQNGHSRNFREAQLALSGNQ